MNLPHNRILIVGPDKRLFQHLKKGLEEKGYTVSHLSEPLELSNVIETQLPELILMASDLDLIITDDLIKRTRLNHPDLPIILLVNEVNPDFLLKSSKLGLSDYLATPFSEKDLLARVQIQLAGPHRHSRILQLADLKLDLDTLKVTRSSQIIDLTPRETALLKFFMRNPNRVLSREVILSRVWAYPTNVDSRAVDVYIGYLRKKIDENFETNLFHTVRGFGYMLSDQASTATY